MKKYIKCSKCELNYILENEKSCSVCDPKMRGKLLSDFAEVEDKFVQQRLERTSERRQDFEVFRALRWNAKMRRV